MKVVHVRDVPGLVDTQVVPAEDIVYVGRPNGRFDFTKAGHFLRNEHPIGQCSICGETHDRPAAIRAFRRMLWHNFSTNPNYRGKALDFFRTHPAYIACWCKPEPCHGDVIVNLYDWLQTEIGQDWLRERDYV